MQNTNIQIIWLSQTDSTNNRAFDGASKYPDKTTWVADFQSAGRGQRGNKWSSRKAENLTFSILFKPRNLLAQNQFAISEATALGVCRYLKNKNVEAKIKWPNDIYVGDKKICGILIENAVAGDKLLHSISGIGLNINQIEFSPELPNPTSLSIETGCEYDRQAELPLLLDSIFYYYDRINGVASDMSGDVSSCGVAGGITTSLTDDYLSLLYRKGEFHTYIDYTADTAVSACASGISGRRFEAKIVGISPTACLLLEDRRGLVKSFAFKEVAYVI